MKKQQRRAKSIEESKQIGGTLQKEARNMLTFLKDSKYVIFVISAFTVSWMPGIVLVFWDLGLHYSGGFQKTKELQCGAIGAINFTIVEQNIGKSCIMDLMIEDATRCDVPGDEKDVCVAVFEHCHDFLIVCITRLCMCMVVFGSVINPVIHGLWYPDFRQAVLELRNR